MTNENTKCEWDDLSDVNVLRSEKRFRMRTAILAELVPKRICPECKVIRPRLGQWMITKDGMKAICRVCYFKKAARHIDEEKLGRVFTRDIRYKVDCRLLTEIRECLGISMAEFARRIGWARSYQKKLEDGLVLSVSQRVVEDVLELIRSFIKSIPPSS